MFGLDFSGRKSFQPFGSYTLAFAVAPGEAFGRASYGPGPHWGVRRAVDIYVNLLTQRQSCPSFSPSVVLPGDFRLSSASLVDLRRSMFTTPESRNLERGLFTEVPGCGGVLISSSRKGYRFGPLDTTGSP